MAAELLNELILMNKLNGILDTLKRELRQGKYARGSKFPSEYDLALRFDVNTKTANKAVSLLAAEGLLERGGRGEGTRVRMTHPDCSLSPIVFLGSTKTEYFAQILQGMQERALKKNVLTVYLSPRPSELQPVLENLADTGIRGIVTHGYGKIRCGSIPVIYLDPVTEEPEMHFVMGDNFRGGRDIVRAFTDRGHRNIAGIFTDSLVMQRRDGVIDAMKEAGIADAESRIFNSMDFTLYETRCVLEKIRETYPDCTAVIGGADPLILNVFRLMPEIFPEKTGKIGLGGFGNLSSINDIVPMATVDQHPFRMGCIAVEKLLEFTESCGKSGWIREYVPMEVLHADSIPVIG